MKMHDGHEATCMCCRNIYFVPYDPGYSEYTPGNDLILECIKGKMVAGEHGRKSDSRLGNSRAIVRTL